MFHDFIIMRYLIYIAWLSLVSKVWLKLIRVFGVICSSIVYWTFLFFVILFVLREHIRCDFKAVVRFWKFVLLFDFFEICTIESQRCEQKRYTD